MATQRTSVSLTPDGKLLFERETLYFGGTETAYWSVADQVKLDSFDAVPTLIKLAPRKPGNVKREWKPKYGWIQEFVDRILSVEAAPDPVPLVDGKEPPFTAEEVEFAKTCLISEQRETAAV